MNTESIPALLKDGSAPMASDELLELLRVLGIDQTTVEHRPVFTVEEAKTYRGEISGAHTKNLFLRDKKGAMWLVTCLEDRQIELKRLAESLGAKHFSFASPERLMQFLGIIPGAVSPFAVVNDRSTSVQLVLDATLKTIQPLNFHPLDNARTTTLSTDHLGIFLEHVGHPPLWLNFDDLSIQS